ncbi:hypothetical protein BKA80DRAFT_268014 [Phyllosticta citrichinensis]
MHVYLSTSLYPSENKEETSTDFLTPNSHACLCCPTVLFTKARNCNAVGESFVSKIRLHSLLPCSSATLPRKKHFESPFLHPPPLPPFHPFHSLPTPPSLASAFEADLRLSVHHRSRQDVQSAASTMSPRMASRPQQATPSCRCRSTQMPLARVVGRLSNHARIPS